MIYYYIIITDPGRRSRSSAAAEAGGKKNVFNFYVVAESEARKARCCASNYPGESVI